MQASPALRPTAAPAAPDKTENQFNNEAQSLRDSYLETVLIGTRSEKDVVSTQPPPPRIRVSQYMLNLSQQKSAGRRSQQKSAGKKECTYTREHVADVGSAVDVEDGGGDQHAALCIHRFLLVKKGFLQ